MLVSMCHAIVIANQERSFWEINQSDCEKVIDNACSFFGSHALNILLTKCFKEINERLKF